MSNENISEKTPEQEKRLAKKMAAEKAAKAEKRSKILFNVSFIVILAAIAFGVVWSVISNIRDKKAEEKRLANLIPVAENYSVGLADDGFVAGINASDYVEVNFDPNESIVIPYAQIEASEEKVQEKIESLVNEHTDEEGNVPEFNDDFIKNSLNSSLTVDEYKDKIREDIEKDNKLQFVKDYVKNDYTIKDIPEDYALKVAGVLKLMDLQQFEYINQFYMTYTGSIMYDSVAMMRDMTEDEYEEYVMNQGGVEATIDLAYQLLYKSLNMSVTESEYNEYLEKNGITDTSVYGVGYIHKTLIYDKINTYLVDHASIEK